MAYDELLADRIRDALSDQESLREQKMFGGLAFMVRDKMVVCVWAPEVALSWFVWTGCANPNTSSSTGPTMPSWVRGGRWAKVGSPSMQKR